MKTRLIIAYLGNIVDIVATLHYNRLGYDELNPIMAWLLQWPAMFVLVKLALMSYVVGLIWVAPKTKLIKVCSWIACIVYGLIIVYYAVAFPIILTLV